jgi:selenocysteine lyase/cysteine desulfurase
VLKSRFSRFLQADPARLHFAAHSHHPWPDASREAQIEYWDDSARLADRKWDRVFGEVVPKAQRHLARMLRLSDPAQVAFAQNTHEFLQRLYSCFDKPSIRVLASGHEFHSFRRQTRRLVEAGRVELEEIAGPPFASFAERFVNAARNGPWDLVFVSHVFFDSAFAIRDIEAICEAAPAGAMVVVDGYHAFCALDVDLTRVHRRAFYLGGGYKYAMSGEAMGYLAVPPGCDLRPLNTGWFASFSSLTGPQPAQVPYAPDAMRFWGATFDPCGVYRFNAAMDMLQGDGVSPDRIHVHSLELQERFLAGLEALALPGLRPAHLVLPRDVPRGNFLVFDVDDAARMFAKLAEHHIAIDRRDRRLRFGFGVYHDESDIDALLEALPRALGR